MLNPVPDAEIHVIPVPALQAKAVRPDLPHGQHHMGMRLLAAVLGFGIVDIDVGDHAVGGVVILDIGGDQLDPLLRRQLARQGDDRAPE